MRILLIAVTYITKVNQKKLEALAAFPDVELQVIVPTIWRETLHTDLSAQIPTQSRYSYNPLPTFLTGRGGRYFYKTIDLTMRKFKPDIVQIEEGWRGLTTFQAVFYRQVWAPASRFVIFSWENLIHPLLVYQNVFQNYNLRHTDHVICGNQDGVASIRDTGYKGPVSVIPQLGVDIETFSKRDGSDMRRQLNLPPETFVIGFAARLVPEKGIMCLLESLTRLPGDWTLLIIGQGPEQDLVKQLIQEMRIASRVRMVGTVPHLELARYYNVMDVLVAPSLTTSKWKEQYGLVVLQAMSSKVPVIGSTCGELPNVIGDAGLIFQEGNVSQLTERLRILQSDITLRNELGQRGYERVHSNYTFQRIAEQTFNVWKGLFNE